MRRPYLSTSVPSACLSVAGLMVGLNSARPMGVDSGLRVSFCMAGNLGVAEKSERLTGCGLSIFKLTTTSREFKNKIGSRNIMIDEFSPTLEALRSTPKNRQISPQTIQTTQALAGRFESLRCSVRRCIFRARAVAEIFPSFSLRMR